MIKTASEQEEKIGDPNQLSDAIDKHEEMKKTLKKGTSSMIADCFK